MDGPGKSPYLAIGPVSAPHVHLGGTVFGDFHLIAQTGGNLDEGRRVLAAKARDLLMQNGLAFVDILRHARAAVRQARHPFPIVQQLQRGARIGLIDEIARARIDARKLFAQGQQQAGKGAVLRKIPGRPARQQLPHLAGIGIGPAA